MSPNLATTYPLPAMANFAALCAGASVAALLLLLACSHICSVRETGSTIMRALRATLLATTVVLLQLYM